MVNAEILLQVNATVIAGTLILLTMGKYPEKSILVFEPYKKSKRTIIRMFAVLLFHTLDKLWGTMPPRLATGLVVIPFSFSSICILLSGISESPFKNMIDDRLINTASMVGFGYLILVIVMLRAPSSHGEEHS